jgi:hypothetical protein
MAGHTAFKNGEAAVAALRTLPEGWATLVDVGESDPRFDGVDHLAVGPGGIFAIFVRSWPGTLTIVDNVVREDRQSREDETEACAGAASVVAEIADRYAEWVVPVLCVTGDQQVVDWAVEVLVCSAATLETALTELPGVLSPRWVAEAAEHLGLEPPAAPPTEATHAAARTATYSATHSATHATAPARVTAPVQVATLADVPVPIVTTPMVPTVAAPVPPRADSDGPLRRRSARALKILEEAGIDPFAAVDAPPPEKSTRRSRKAAKAADAARTAEAARIAPAAPGKKAAPSTKRRTLVKLLVALVTAGVLVVAAPQLRMAAGAVKDVLSQQLHGDAPTACLPSAAPPTHHVVTKTRKPAHGAAARRAARKKHRAAQHKHHHAAATPTLTPALTAAPGC